MNATNLFRLGDGLQNSESFWSSLFALQLMDSSSRGIHLKIPVFIYEERDREWSFKKQKEYLPLPEELNFKSVIVEGKLRSGVFSDINETLPSKYHDLRPDVSILWGQNYTIIETKTVGAKITAKESLYFDLCAWLRERGINANTYLLLSAGHESNSEMSNLTTWQTKPKLILWEQFFKTIEAQDDSSLLSRLLPSLKQYYKNEKDYLSSIG